MIAQGVKLTIVARPYFSFSPPRDNEKSGLASQTNVWSVQVWMHVLYIWTVMIDHVHHLWSVSRYVLHVILFT